MTQPYLTNFHPQLVWIDQMRFTHTYMGWVGSGLPPLIRVTSYPTTPFDGAENTKHLRKKNTILYLITKPQIHKKRARENPNRNRI